MDGDNDGTMIAHNLQRDGTTTGTLESSLGTMVINSDGEDDDDSTMKRKHITYLCNQPFGLINCNVCFCFLRCFSQDMTPQKLILPRNLTGPCFWIILTKRTQPLPEQTETTTVKIRRKVMPKQKSRTRQSLIFKISIRQWSHTIRVGFCFVSYLRKCKYAEASGSFTFCSLICFGTLLLPIWKFLLLLITITDMVFNAWDLLLL